MVVLGIDPGTAITGYGVVIRKGMQDFSLLECGVIRTSAGQALPARIREIYEGVRAIIARHEPAVIAVENVFQGKNIQSALTLGHARGVILLAGSLANLVIAEYSPREIKKAVVGNGNATKAQVGFMVKERLRLKAAPAPEDASDGVAAALCYCTMGIDAPMHTTPPNAMSRR